MTILDGKQGFRTVISGVAVIGIIVILGFQSTAAASVMASIAALSLLALSLDFAWGYGGILSLGHGLFFGAPAYIAALLVRAGVDSFLILSLVALLSGALLALIIGLFMFAGSSNLSLIYIVMTTLALSYVAERIARTWGLIGADTGIAGLRPPSLMGLKISNAHTYLIVSAIALLLIFLLMVFLTRRDWGIVLTAVRENEQRMIFSGYNVAKTKIQIFTISGAVAGLGGYLYVFNIGIVTPGTLGIFQSTLPVVWVLAGGLGTLIGPMVGTLVVQYLSDKLSLFLQGWWEVVLGLILIVVLVLFPRGLLGLLRLGNGKKSASVNAQSKPRGGEAT